MKKLIKTYGLNSDMQYFELIVESLKNGQRKQAINQFLSMDKAYRVKFIKNASVIFFTSHIQLIINKFRYSKSIFYAIITKIMIIHPH